MSLYTDLAIDVAALLAELGQAGTVRRTTITGGGPSDPTGGTPSATDYSVRLVVFPVSDDRIDGTNILAGDWQVICEPGDVEFTAEDAVICTEGTLTIAWLGKIAPAGETVAYDMVCRG